MNVKECLFIYYEHLTKLLTPTAENPIAESASFTGKSWVEFGRELIMKDRDERSITLEFTTASADGLLLWHGQDETTSGRGLDYFSVARECQLFITITVRRQGRSS